MTDRWGIWLAVALVVLSACSGSDEAQLATPDSVQGVVEDAAATTPSADPRPTTTLSDPDIATSTTGPADEAAAEGEPTTTTLGGPSTTGPSDPDPSTTTAPSTSTTDAPATTTTTTTSTTTTIAGPSTIPPNWLGTIALPLRSDGHGEIQPTPPELIDRRFPPPWFLRRGSTAFESTIGPIPSDVLARSTWGDSCPVGLDELSYLTVSFIGFDGGSYVGELIVNAAHADAMVGVFRAMFDSRFPLEEVRVVAPWELDAAPTGDGNNTTAFVCRPVTGGSGWSQHAYGLAIDINPFHNPYKKADLVLPELATFYTDQALGLPGMITEGDVVVAAFDSLGWGWGGRWNSLTDPQHFSATNR